MSLRVWDGEHQSEVLDFAPIYLKGMPILKKFFYINKKRMALEIWFRPEQVQKDLHVSVVKVDGALYPFFILPEEPTFCLNLKFFNW